jgi:CRP/FNR family cyclic AMP-dependent transcriptional regulator
MELTKALSYNYVFRGLPKEVVAGIAALAEIRQYLGGDTIVRQFERTTDMYVLLEGSARIKSYSGRTLAEFGPGSVIGEIALIDDEPRSATVVAAGPIRAAVISAQLIRGMMETDPRIANVLVTNICRVLCRRLRTMNAYCAEPVPRAISA